MSFPMEDVVNNFRHFLLSVKRATGNSKESDNTDRKSGGAKPGEVF